MAAVAAMEAAETVLTRLGRRLLAAQQDLEKLERLGGVERGQNGPLEEGQVMPLALADSGRAGASSSLAGSHNTEAVGHSSTEDGMEASSSLGGSARREGDIEASLMVLAELRGHIGACLALLEQPPNQVTDTATDAYEAAKDQTDSAAQTSGWCTSQQATQTLSPQGRSVGVELADAAAQAAADFADATSQAAASVSDATSQVAAAVADAGSQASARAALRPRSMHAINRDQ